MAHTHGGPDDHQPHGGAGGLGWDLLDSIMLGCFVVTSAMLAELAVKHWRARKVRYNLTPAGLAVTEPVPGPLVDREALKAELDRLDAEDAARRKSSG